MNSGALAVIVDASAQYTLFIALAPLAALLALGVLLHARLSYPSPETSALTWLMLMIIGWMIFNALELLDPTEAGTIFWSKASYGFIAFTPVAWLAFALRYAGHERWLAPSRFVFFCVTPLVTTLAAWSNDLHRLLWAQYHFQPVGEMLAFSVTHGPWFWVHAVHSYALVFLGAFLIFRQYFRSFTLYRRQSTWLVIGAFAPIAVNAIYIFRLIPPLVKDYTSVSFAFAGAAFAVGMLRYHLFDLKPVARDVVVNSMSDAMLAIDRRGRVVDLNPAAQAIIGRPADAIIGHPAVEVLSAWRDLVERYRDQHHVQAEIVLTHNGAPRHYDLRVSPLTDQRGLPSGRLIVLRDITERKQAEEALQRYNVELEARNAELDTFAHTVAHGLKNPLTTLMGYSQFAQSNFPAISPEDMEHVLSSIIQNAQKMNGIIDALLLFARVRTLENVSVAPLNMEAILTVVLERLAALSERYQAQMAMPDHWPAALGYAAWIEEVWMNYISNAIKYGGPQPRVELGADEEENGASGRPSRVRFWVRDHGPGISAEKQARLFLVFSRLEAGNAEGHGLGLSIVQRIVKKLGGDAGVESRVGEGSLFWFTLPAGRPPVVAIPSAD